jgi:SAM-dependent methyltransferase
MIAPRELPREYADWNMKFGAPFGFRNSNRLKTRLIRKFDFADLTYRWDPFALQSNSSNRTFEYPWVFQNLPTRPSDLLEIGGGVSGLQFVLSKYGHRVVNVDPGQTDVRAQWSYTTGGFDKLNRRFGASVELRPTPIEKSNLETEKFDAAYSISVLEHIDNQTIQKIMQEVWRGLKPGGLFILTIDLFLNLSPFTRREANHYGTNVNVRQLIECAPFDLLFGRPSELYGFDHFSSDAIQSCLEDYLIAESYPVLTQCIILKKVCNRNSFNPVPATGVEASS